MAKQRKSLVYVSDLDKSHALYMNHPLFGFVPDFLMRYISADAVVLGTFKEVQEPKELFLTHRELFLSPNVERTNIPYLDDDRTDRLEELLKQEPSLRILRDGKYVICKVRNEMLNSRTDEIRPLNFEEMKLLFRMMNGIGYDLIN